jgi:hypothetical protein
VIDYVIVYSQLIWIGARITYTFSHLNSRTGQSVDPLLSLLGGIPNIPGTYNIKPTPRASGPSSRVGGGIVRALARWWREVGGEAE